MINLTVTASSGLRVRTAPDTSANNIIGLLPYGAKIQAIRTTPKWAQIPIQAGGVVVGSGWASMDYLKPDDVIQPDTSRTSPAYLLGVHELKSGRAREALQMGARCVMVFNDANEANALSKSYPDAIVMHRIYFTTELPPADLLARHGINIYDSTPSDSRVYIRVFNEGDVSGFDSSIEGINKRANYEREILRLLQDHAPFARLVCGGFSVGNPDFTNPDICNAVKENYADLYNERKIWFDIHSYSICNPNNPKDYAFYESKWDVARYRFLFWNCGFDPNVRQILSSEAGVEAGHGGYAWAGYTDDEFRAHCVYMMNAHNQPITVNGREYPSPMRGATIFQDGNDYTGAGGWAGYNISHYRDAVLRDMWIASQKRDMTMRELNTGGNNVLPSGYTTPIKRIALKETKR